ncbi:MULTISPECIES: helix-turn-helix domain-containing protein [Cyanophyceae]|uniref:helix-turn-helix domain-containing protein n=1 Tax=Cyanophyceae TaxID=3028117 RepID=UPI001682E5BE|nr:helix-turn-helix domain-containing protein [Trichocoleus sp. FACHB-69]MBD1932731.1 helix-turn-helix domain-containing protein [Trichocoleus sp. FACHB-69]
MIKSDTGSKGRVQEDGTGRYRFDRMGIMRVGEILRKARETKGWSLQELHNYCGLPASSVSDLENACVTKVQADALETLRVALEPQNPDTGMTYTLGDLYEMMLVREGETNGAKGKS